MRFLEPWLSEKYLKILRYLIAGGSAAATNIGVLYVLTEYVGIWYLLSSVISFSVAWVVSFTLHKFWTFRNYGMERVHVQAPLHLTLTVIDLFLNTAILYALVEFFAIWYIGGQVVAGLFIAVINFYMYKRFIFASEEKAR